MAEHLKSKLAFYDVPASDPEASRRFYEALLGTNIPHAPRPERKDFFHPISPGGIDLTIHPREDRDPPEIPIAYFAVDNLDEAIRELESVGGRVEGPRIEIPLPQGQALEHYRSAAKAARHEVGKRVGIAQKMLDPDRNPVGLVQLEAHAAYYFRAGPFHQPLRADQVKGVERALEAAKK